LTTDNYADFVFQFDERHYRARVEMAGFVGADKVLDAGSGFGQWTATLARCNGSVVGIDINPNMVEISRRYCRRQGVQNATFRQEGLPRLQFPAETFDLIWCWSVLMFVPVEETLKEFHRLLRPGGRLLIGCCNGIGRWLFKACDALKRPRNWPVLKTCFRTLAYGHRRNATTTYFTFNRCRKLCAQQGFRLIAADLDGHIDLTGRGRRLPMFPERFLGFPQNLEFIAEKPA
jgi:ubiquinone/menaquinone biosynthesis C-methylase UbiE